MKVDVYEFNELDEEAQEEVIEREKELKRKTGLPELYDTMMMEGEHLIKESETISLGELNNIFYDLSHAQGEGVCIEGIVYAEDGYGNTWGVNFGHDNSNYYHENTLVINAIRLEEKTNPDGLQDTEKDMKESVRSELKSICKELKEIGYDHIDHALSDEVIKEGIESRGKLYLEDGTEVPDDVEVE